jgi:hypothetical protein|tara:strand:+ start:560 stop:814 length:255 start_codon:yes stop_codon:yes gene_type:complete
MPTKFKQKGKPKDFTGGDFYKKSRSKKMMGGSMVETMQGQMKEKMAEPRSGYAHGGKSMGAKADIASMEKSCSAMAGKNNSVTY